jgi:hypothetical protein
MTILGSQGWSGVNAIGGDDVGVGYAITLGSDGASMVAATAANLAASPSGRVHGVATTPASARQVFQIAQVGLLDPSQVPYVGAGNSTDYVVVDSAGRLVRSATYTSAVVGVPGKDGSVILSPALGNQITVQNPGTNLALVTTTIAVGDVVTTANDALFSKIARATATLLQTANTGFGIALTGATPPLGIAVWSGPGTTVSAATIGLGVGVAAYGIVVANRVQRSLAPTASDFVVGTVNPNGDLYVMPIRFEGSNLVVGGVGFPTANDGSVDVSDQLQAAINAAAIDPASLNLSRGNLVVRLPKGAYLVRKPIQVSRQGAIIEGSYQDCSHIYTDSVAMTVLYCSPADRPFPIATNAFNGLNAAIITRADPPEEHYLNLRETGAGADLNGLTAFTMRMKVKVTSVPTDGDNHMFISFGRRFTTEGVGSGIQHGNYAFGLDFEGTIGAVPTGLVYLLTTSGSGFTVAGPAGGTTLANGSWHEVECAWDGTTSRVFVDGTLYASVGATGTLVQADWESVLFGRGAYQHLGCGVRVTQPPNMQIASFELSNVARHTANYTPANAKFAADTNTLVLLNFDDQRGINTVATCRGMRGSAGLNQAWYPNRYENTPLSGKTSDLIRVRSLTITNALGPGLEFENSPHSIASDVNITSRNPIRITNNSFLSEVHRAKLNTIGGVPNGLVQSRVAIMIGDRCYGTNICTLDTQQFQFGIDSQADFALSGSVYILCCRQPILAFQAGQVNIGGTILITDEGATVQSVPIDYMIALVGVSAAVVTGIDGGLLETSAPDFIIDDCNTINAHRNIVITGNALNIVPGQRVARVIGSFDGGVVFDHNSVLGTNWNWLTDDSSTDNSTEVRPLKTLGAIGLSITDANQTITINQRLYRCLNISGTLTATRTISVPPGVNCGEVVVRNLTGQTLAIKAVGGATTTNVTAGAARIFTITATELLPI